MNEENVDHSFKVAWSINSQYFKGKSNIQVEVDNLKNINSIDDPLKNNKDIPGKPIISKCFQKEFD